MQRIKDKLIESGVKNIREFGYPDVDKNSIFTDEIYSRFFVDMLKDNLGKGYDDEIKEILQSIEERK